MIGPHDDPDNQPDNDRDAGTDGDLWVRPYTATNGRTHPSTALDLMSLVKATGRGTIAPERLGYEHAQALRLCRSPTSVAEVAAYLRQPVNVAKVLLSDLIDVGAVATRFPTSDADTTPPDMLEALIEGLRNL